MCEPSPQAFTGYAGAADLTTARLLPAPPELCALLRASLGPNSLALTLCADHAAEVRAQADRDAAAASASDGVNWPVSAHEIQGGAQWCACKQGLEGERRGTATSFTCSSGEQ